MIDREGSGIVGMVNGCLLELAAAAVIVLVLIIAHGAWTVLWAAFGG